jgi:hypothetical protein
MRNVGLYFALAWGALTKRGDSAVPSRRRVLGSAFTLDLTVAAGAMAAMTTAVFSGSGDVNDRSTATDFAGALLTLQRNVQGSLGSVGYGSIAIADGDVIALGVVPAPLVSGTTIKNPWSSASNAVDIAGVSGTSFTISAAAVPKTACVAVLQRASSAAGLTSAVINGATAITTLPVTDASIAAGSTGCNAVTNTIVLASR